MTDEQLSPEEQAKAAQVAAAGGAAVVKAQQEGKSAEEAKVAAEAAMQARGREVGSPISDEDASKIAETVIEKLREYGAFDPPTPTPTAATPTPTPEQLAAHEAAIAATNPVPQRKTLAERYAGI